MDRDAPLDCLGLRLGAAFRRIDRLFNRGYARLGLTHAHAQVLLTILRSGPLRASAVARETGFEPSTVSHLLQELSRKRLVLRRRDPDDARALLLRPSTKAVRLQPDLLAMERRLNERLLRGLAEEDLRGLLNVTRALDRLP